MWAVNNFVIDHPATLGNPVVRESLLSWQVKNLVNGGNANDFPPTGWTQTSQGAWIVPAKKPIGTLLADLDSAVASLKAALLA